MNFVKEADSGHELVGFKMLTVSSVWACSWGMFFALQSQLKVKSLKCYVEGKTRNSPLEDSLFFEITRSALT